MYLISPKTNLTLKVRRYLAIVPINPRGLNPATLNPTLNPTLPARTATLTPAPHLRMATAPLASREPPTIAATTKDQAEMQKPETLGTPGSNPATHRDQRPALPSKPLQPSDRPPLIPPLLLESIANLENVETFFVSPLIADISRHLCDVLGLLTLYSFNCYPMLPVKGLLSFDSE
jgi:hypothetical protein